MYNNCQSKDKQSIITTDTTSLKETRKKCCYLHNIHILQHRIGYYGYLDGYWLANILRHDIAKMNYLVRFLQNIPNYTNGILVVG